MQRSGADQARVPLLRGGGDGVFGTQPVAVQPPSPHRGFGAGSSATIPPSPSFSSVRPPKVPARRAGFGAGGRFGRTQPTPSASAPRAPLVLHPGGCCVWSIPVLLTLLTLVLVALAVLAFVPSVDFPPSQPFHMVWLLGVVLLVLAVLLPCCLVFTAAWCKRPGRRARQLQSFYDDSLLDQMLTGNVAEHYDVDGAANAAAGTVVLLAGASAPRCVLKTYARQWAHTFRTICVDLPGHGSLFAVAYSLSRCERVLHRVLMAEAPQDRVLLVAQGASCYVAMHLAHRMRGQLAGVVCLGDIPRYMGAFRCSWTAWTQSPYRLAWYRHLVNRSYKATIELGSLPEEAQRAATRDDFNLEARPVMLNEIRGEPLVARMLEYSNPVLFYGSSTTNKRLRPSFAAASNVKFDDGVVRVGQVLPPLEPELLAVVCNRVADFAATLNLARESSTDTERRKGSWNSFSSFASSSAGVASAASPRGRPTLPTLASGRRLS